MGGGISLVEGGVEELLATTILIGRAISAVTFPGMHRIYDFHSHKAPRIKNAQNFTFFAPDSDDEDEDGLVDAPDPSEYEHFFHVVVGNDTIYLEDPLYENENGWTPLHTCCMSMSTLQAAFAIIDETVKRGGSFEVKTKVGPGTFNKGWTALHMACAYGAEPIVEKLVLNGADVNCVNSFGYSCLLEACHRGFINIVKFLINTPSSSKPVDFTYIPSEQDAMNSPFSSAPCQSALGEAARCGFFKVVELLIESGAPIDLPNALGWTPLHEACFYNRIETVRVLLTKGSNPVARTRLGALPYHLAGLSEIRDLLRSLGGEKAVPNEGDVIDMIEILTELTMPEQNARMNTNSNTSSYIIDFSGDSRKSTQRGGKFTMQTMHFDPSFLEEDDEMSERMEPVSAVVAETKASATAAESKVSAGASGSSSSSGTASAAPSKYDHKLSGGGSSSSASEEKGSSQGGALLGALPSLSPSKNPALNGRSLAEDLDRALALNEQPSSSSSSSSAMKPGGLFGGSPSNRMQSGGPKVSKKADGKDKKMKKKGPPIPADMPSNFICQLTQQPMSEPVKTIYGNVFDKTAIMNWLATQGKICPLSGAPLSDVDITPCVELGEEIRKWILKKSMSANIEKTASSSTAPNDDLYDF